MKIQRNKDWVDYFLFVLICLFIWFCIVIVKCAKTHHDEITALPPEMSSIYPEIPQCDKELWLRIKDGCP